MSDVSFLAADWPAPDGVVAGTTLRVGGASSPPYAELNLGAHVGDEPGRVEDNRRRLAAHLRLPAEPCWLRQQHGSTVVRVPCERPEPEADAAVTGVCDVVCAVLTADCLPVLLAATDGSAVGAAHAGWRGLSGGILEAAVAAFDGAPLIAWLGPAISQPAFEVGGEVRQRFVAQDPAASASFRPNARGRWQADLCGLARRRLERAGVSAVYGGDRCTYREADAFYSYRRDGQCGRMASLIFRRGGR